MSLLNNTYTVESFIANQSDDEMNFTSFSTFQKTDSDYFLFPIKNLLHDYLNIIMSKTTIIEMTTEEYNKYEYRPHLLSYDIYGTTDFDFIILMINYMKSPKEFTRKEIRMLGYDEMIELLTSIYNAEYNNISHNKETIGM